MINSNQSVINNFRSVRRCISDESLDKLQRRRSDAPTKLINFSFEPLVDFPRLNYYDSTNIFSILKELSIEDLSLQGILIRHEFISKSKGEKAQDGEQSISQVYKLFDFLRHNRPFLKSQEMSETKEVDLSNNTTNDSSKDKPREKRTSDLQRNKEALYYVKKLMDQLGQMIGPFADPTIKTPDRKKVIASAKQIIKCIEDNKQKEEERANQTIFNDDSLQQKEDVESALKEASHDDFWEIWTSILIYFDDYLSKLYLFLMSELSYRSDYGTEQFLKTLLTHPQSFLGSKKSLEINWDLVDDIASIYQSYVQKVQDTEVSGQERTIIAHLRITYSVIKGTKIGKYHTLTPLTNRGIYFNDDINKINEYKQIGLIKELMANFGIHNAQQNNGDFLFDMKSKEVWTEYFSGISRHINCLIMLHIILAELQETEITKIHGIDIDIYSYQQNHQLFNTIIIETASEFEKTVEMLKVIPIESNVTKINWSITYTKPDAKKKSEDSNLSFYERNVSLFDYNFLQRILERKNLLYRIK